MKRRRINPNSVWIKEMTDSWIVHIFHRLSTDNAN
jgi:hypothetical protein